MRCGTPYCSVSEFWCYRCKMKATECGCGYCTSWCFCGNKKNWMILGDHKSAYLSRLREGIAFGGTEYATTQELAARLTEAEKIGTYPPVLGSYLNPFPYLYLEGNNGGDFLSITQHCLDSLQIEVGHCCVVSGAYELPVEFLTDLLTELFLNDPQKYPLRWDDEFAGEIRQRIRKLKPFEIYPRRKTLDWENETSPRIPTKS